MAETILDASAVLALLQSESGAARVREALPSALLSSVNAAEVVARLLRFGGDPDSAVDLVRRLKCPIVPVDDHLGLRAGVLYTLTARFDLSLADRICLALAERERLPVLTADRA